MRLSFVLRNTILVLTLALWSSMTMAQTSDLGPPMTLSNASFEDVPRTSHAPRGWFDCSFSNESAVDVHPQTLLKPDSSGFFGVTATAFDGNTYLGMVVRDNDTYEAVSQRIIEGPLKAGQCYTFSIYLSRAAYYKSLSRTSTQRVNYDTPVKLRIWGGFSYCNRGEVLAESAPVKKSEWLQYNFRFEPKKDHQFLVLEAYYKTPVLFPYNGNLLLDAAGKIKPIACDNSAPPEPEPEVSDVPEADPPKKDPVKPAVVDVPVKQTPTVPAKPVNKNATLAGKRISELKAGSIIRVDKLFFKADSTALSPSSMATIDEITDFLTIHSNVSIEIGGHTNNIPADSFCDKLSLARATSVVDQLVKRGIERSRLEPVGYGKRKPVATNRTPTGRKRNQRVEIKVLSLGS